MADPRPAVLRLLASAGLALAVLALVVATPGGGQQAAAASFAVTRFDDPAPDGCAPGDCSLREAIIDANAAAGADAITLPAGTYTLSIAGADENAAATGDLDITDDLTLTGAGASATILDGADLDRVFDVHSSTAGGAVEITGVTVQNGSVGTSGGGLRNKGTLTLTDATFTGNESVSSHGGAIQNNPPPAGALTMDSVTVTGNTANNGFGGGIDNRDRATLTDVTVSANSASGGGGGIHDFGGTMSVINSTISENTTPGNGGGLFLDSSSALTVAGSAISGNTSQTGFGGGIHNTGGSTVTLTNTALSENSALFGGGIDNEAGTVEVTDSTIRGNAGTGGGINNMDTLTVTRSTISGNDSSAGLGGGINNNGLATVTNSTISGNTADIGGGIYNFVELTTSNSTITDNTAVGVVGAGGGIRNEGSATLKNSIIAGNPAGDDCSATAAITSGGHNLDGDGTCGFAAAGDLPSTDPDLGPLAGNGGPTETHALLAGSPAIDAGSADCPPPSTDQRGVARPVDGDEDGSSACDIGAYEFEPALPTPTPPATVAALPSTGAGSLSGGSPPAWLLAALAATGVAMATAHIALRLRRR